MKALVFTFLMAISFASNASILCHTPRMNKIFEIKDNRITFYNEFDAKAKRELASVNALAQKDGNGFTNTVDFENQKHVIHISNLNEFSDFNDYIIIKAKTGHEVTYPLTCSRK